MNDIAIQPEGEEKGKGLPVSYLWLFGFIYLAGFLLRWFALDERPVHHDESLHLMYGRYFFDWPEFHYYKYDPMLHGPLLYNVLRFVYLTLGSTTWAGRSLVCFLGTLFIFAPLLFRRYFTRNGLLAITSAIALSPTLIYWSRFIREDNLQLAAMLLTLVGVIAVRDRLKVIVAFIGITLQFCEKENSYVTMALLAGYLLFEAFFNGVVFHFDDSLLGRAYKQSRKYWKVTVVAFAPGAFINNYFSAANVAIVLLAFYFLAEACLSVYAHSSESLLGSLCRYLRRCWKETVIAAGLGALIYSYLFSAGFRYSAGILDGIYRKSIAYWVNQHNIERISGPFLFHVYMLTWYEVAFVAIVLAQMYVFYKRADRFIWIPALFIGVFGALVAMNSASSPEMKEWFPFKLFRLKDPLWMEIFALFVITFQPILVTVQHLYRKEKALAFWGYLFFASLFTYSFLGEKVPWLSLYPMVPGMIYLVLYFQDYFKDFEENWFKNYPANLVLRIAGFLICLVGLLCFFEEHIRDIHPANWMIVGIGALILALGFLDWWLKILGSLDIRAFAFAGFVIFNLRTAGLVNFVYAGKASEFISQVHTTYDFHNYVRKLRGEITNPLNGVPPKVLGIEDSVWPVTWYMVDVPQYKFDAPQEERKDFDYIIQNWKEGPEAPPVPAGFRPVRMSLRGWWVPDYDKMTLRRFLNYSINHVPWSDTGFSYVNLLVKEKK